MLATCSGQKVTNASSPNTLDRYEKKTDHIFESLCAATADGNVTKQTPINVGSYSKPSRKIALIADTRRFALFRRVSVNIRAMSLSCSDNASLKTNTAQRIAEALFMNPGFRTEPVLSSVHSRKYKCAEEETTPQREQGKAWKWCPF